MRKLDVVQHFGSVSAVAAALGITHASVSQWGETIPVRRAYEIERITGGALVVQSPPNQPEKPSAW